MALAMEVFNQSIPAFVSSTSINLGTMGTNRVCLLFVHTDGATRQTVSSVSDGNGLTWALYKAFNFDSEDPTNHKQRLEIWWAFAAALQSANPVTITFTGSTNPTIGIGAIAGLDPTRYTSPFDSDTSLGLLIANPSATFANATQTFSTHDSQSVVLSIFASNITNSPPSTPSGWTALINANGLSSFQREILYVYGKIYTAQQVNTVVDMGSTVDWGITVIAAGGDIRFPHSLSSCAGF